MSSVSVKERPILFSGPMIRAILDDHKTQTRRVIKPQPASCAADVYADLYNRGPEWAFWLPDNRMTEPRTWRCPYGEASDHLWVRETWAGDDLNGYVYRADHPEADLGQGDLDDGEQSIREWHPSIFMPRQACRIKLEILSVRVERLRNISLRDAMSEGVRIPSASAGEDDYRRGFASGWDSLNSERGFGWGENPWVWVIGFKRITR